MKQFVPALVLAISVLSFIAAAESTTADAVSQDPTGFDSAFPPAMSSFFIKSGDERINGLIYMAAGAGPHPTVVLLHGYPGNERNLDLAQGLRRAGTNVIYFNYRGSWGSGGTFSVANALADVKQILATARDPQWATKYRIDTRQIALVGHSFGGFLGAVSTAQDPALPCYVHIAGADMGAFGMQALSSKAAEAELSTGLGGDLQAQGSPLKGDIKQLMQDLKTNAKVWSLPMYAKQLAKTPLLLISAENDQDTPVAQHHQPFASALRDANASALTTLSYKDDHSFSAHRIELTQQVIRWQQQQCWNAQKRPK